MGHSVEFYDYPENCNKSKVEQALNDYVRHATWQEGGSGLYRPIRWLNPFARIRRLQMTLFAKMIVATTINWPFAFVRLFERKQVCNRKCE